MDKIEKAILFASKAHKGQCRKKTNIPYISHPFTVAFLLMKEQCSEDVIIAGLLHDLIEDTSVTLQEIETEFGENVAKIVRDCSEPDGRISWEERKNNTIQKLRNAPLEVKYVACADKLHNICSMIADHKKYGDRLWKRFSRGYDKQQWYYRSIVRSLFYGLNHVEPGSLFYRFRDKVEELFGLDDE
ncbi:HD domain-containing protein [candidate division KSB1 bacterium]|nr:HD domain-containing protein [candidate division KSB1 bacterium]